MARTRLSVDLSSGFATIEAFFFGGGDKLSPLLLFSNAFCTSVPRLLVLLNVRPDGVLPPSTYLL